MTGRAAGYCAGYSVPGYANPIYGRGFWGRGRGGGGRGHRNWFYATGLTGWQRTAFGYPDFGGWYRAPYAAPYPPAMTSEQEIDMLKDQAEDLEATLDEIRKRREELEAKAKVKEK
jgi:hypothetical protein